MENFGVECTQSSGKLWKYPHFISKRVFLGVRVCRQQHHLDDCNMMGDGCVVSMSIAINSLLAGRDNVPRVELNYTEKCWKLIGIRLLCLKWDLMPHEPPSLGNNCPRIPSRSTWLPALLYVIKGALQLPRICLRGFKIVAKLGDKSDFGWETDEEFHLPLKGTNRK